MTTEIDVPNKVLVPKDTHTKPKKDKKQFISVSTHLTKDDLALLKRVLLKEKTSVYAFIKKCLLEKIEQQKINDAMGLPPIPNEEDLLG